jgi:hypothetical protein
MNNKTLEILGVEMPRPGSRNSDYVPVMIPSGDVEDFLKLMQSGGDFEVRRTVWAA